MYTGEPELAGERSRFPPAIFLMGPTGAGKTELAVDLVSRLPCSILSVDSAMIYRGMDIGTAKPGHDIRARAPHRLIDILDPAEAYSAARFRRDALREMGDITASGRIPLLVGGTGLYFRALDQGISELPSANAALRARMEAEAARHGWSALHQRLARIDPAAAARIHANDAQRVQRALEVYALSGRTITNLIALNARRPLPYRAIKVVVAPGDRMLLHERLRTRFLAMLDEGLVDEVQGLYRRGDLSPSLPAIRLVGYRQVWQYLEGKLDGEAMKMRSIVATRQLAKRQFTWFRAERGAAWLDSGSQDCARNLRHYLNQELMGAV